jgi:predicted DNA repair protein MutK
MAAASLLALIDDIASVLDDVSVLTKAAAKKTAGVLGDDLALNAQQVAGVNPDRELPVVWAVAKGSVINKSILVPAALAISAFAPWLIMPLLMLGGAFLCYEGVEKLAHGFVHDPQEAADRQDRAQAAAQPTMDLQALEQDKIKGAVRTDFILSAEIVTIALGAVAGAEVAVRVAVLVGIAALMTVGVYGLVAGIVKLDDLGLHLSQRPDALRRRLGRWILAAAPWLMKALSMGGTAAMFLVGGGILAHGLPLLEHGVEPAVHVLRAVQGLGPALAVLAPLVVDAMVGMAAGAVVLAIVMALKHVWSSVRGSRT